VLLRYLSEPVLRESITTITNRVGSFYNFSKWLSFGNAGVIGDNDPDHLEKIVKSTARSSYNAAELTVVLNQLAGEGHPVRGEDVAALSPNSTRHILRFGDYVLDLTPPSSTVSTHLETAQSNRRSCREFARQTMVQLGRKTSSVLWRVSAVSRSSPLSTWEPVERPAESRWRADLRRSNSSSLFDATGSRISQGIAATGNGLPVRYSSNMKANPPGTKRTDLSHSYGP
jgi:hypothetical protein